MTVLTSNHGVGATAWADDATAAKPKRKRNSPAAGSAETSDYKLACEFAERFGDQFRFDATEKRWFYFEGQIWRGDEIGRADAAMMDILQGHGIGSAKKHRDAMRLATFHPDVAVTHEAWNPNPDRLGTPAGVFDLTTGKLLPALPDHMVSMSTSVAPNFDVPATWLQFLEEATKSEPGYARYLQQLCGYCLTGRTNFELFWFLYGDGGGGKGTFLDTFAAVAGDYGWKAASRTLLASKQDRHLSELAAFKGKRMVYISETPAGQNWDMARVKELTGGDTINANRMRQDPITFRPTHKLIAMGNNAPSVPQIDNSVRRRFRILPFNNIVPEDKRDATLKDRLKAELPQILGWAIEGARDVIANGFAEPDVVRRESEQYFSEQDGFEEWIDARCYRGQDHGEAGSTLLRSWTAFRKDRGEHTENANQFAERLRRKGFVRVKRNGISWWIGLTLNGTESAS